MLIGRVVGTVVATRKDESLVGSKLLIVQIFDCKGGSAKVEGRGQVVAVDSVGAGVGELVLVVTGSTASRVMARQEAPVDAAVVGIVDTLEVLPDTGE
ncbi:ethanolamine utilization protein EutN [Clostridiales bacterium PH28_bin88]|nr:ethanolamine utilization protein EutN [Clostridiales bacterium PH28_bin88]